MSHELNDYIVVYLCNKWQVLVGTLIIEVIELLNPNY
jgi:hypothetical protein